MKIKLFVILAGLFATGISDVKSEVPAIISGEDTTNNTYYPTVDAPFILQPGPNIPVNEGEIRAGLLYDVVNKKIVWQKNMTGIYPIASLTKMMGALLAIEDVKAGKFSWTDNISWTREVYVGRRKHRKKVSTPVNYSLRDVFKASMIASNNECAEQLARFIGYGDLQATIERMNMRAKELKMMNTFFSNPTGLPAPHSMFDNSSTPSDLLLLTMEMLNHKEVIEIASMGYAEIENGKSTSVISNHNRLTIDFSGEVDGLKTGYTRRAGFCLVATTAKCEHRLVSIVLGCRGPQIRNEVVRDMFNDYYTHIGLDRLGPMCPAPLEANNLKQTKNGSYVTVYESAKKFHYVKNGESLSKIASKYKCTVSQLKSWNKKTVKGSQIRSGQKLAVYYKKPKSIFIENPVNGDESDEDKPLITDAEKKELEKDEKKADEPKAVIEKAVVKPASKYLYHVVAPGDTLFSIANRYKGTTVEEIKSLNKISDHRNLKPGTKLKVKVSG